MFEGIMATNNVSFILVFIEGILSFFSPCVIPLIPVYMSYLAGNTNQLGDDGTIIYHRKKVFFHTICFVLGISFAFFILGMSFTAMGNFFNSNKLLFTRIGGILIVILGLFQIGIFDFSFLQRERKIHLKLTDKKVNPLVALIMGFTFSFAWTPCVGPALSSVLILASGAKNSLTGNLLVVVYSIGFILPFLILGLFTTQVLSFLKAKQKLLKYTIKVGGIILIFIGIMTFTGWINGVSGYLSSYSGYKNKQSEDTQEQIIEDSDTKADTDYENKETSDKEGSSTSDNDNTISDSATPDNDNPMSESDASENKPETSNNESKVIPAIDFTLTDQYGNEHTLSDYKGKVVFLNFWATWCPPCKEEMPHIEELYKEYNLNEDEVVILGVANPKSEEYPYNQDEEIDVIKAFLEENEYTFPVVFDETGELFSQYYITAFPTTFMIDKEGNVYGYVPGMMTKDIMKSIIQETIDSTK